MNTLPRATTALWFQSTDDYQALRRHWRALMQSERRRELNAAHHLLYLALLGKDWRRAFTPPTNPRKLANGAFTGWPLFGALGSLRHGFRQQQSLAPFDGLVTPAMVAALRAYIPELGYTRCKPEDFSRGRWAIAAYAPAETQNATAGQHA